MFYAGKKCVVTGASGLIGSYVVKLLKEAGAHVRAICHRRETNDLTTLADEVYWLDLSVPACARDAVRDAEIVMSCAGITGGIGLPAIDAVSYVGPASVITMNTLHACAQEKVKHFGFLSSTTVYAPSGFPVTESYVNSSEELYPLYRGIGESKRFLEKLCSYYAEKTDLMTAVIRPSGAYGRYDNFDEKTSHVLPGLVNRALALGENEKFEVWGDGEDTRDLVHAEDVARCLLLATEKITDGRPVNAASGQGITTKNLAKAILFLAGKYNTIVTNSTKPSALKTRLVDIALAKSLLGYEPKISLEEGIKDVIEWRRGRK